MPMATASTSSSLESASGAAAQTPRRVVHGGEPLAPDPQLVADVKHEISALVQEITQLASQDISRDEFFSGFLNRVVAALGAVGGAVWTHGDGGRLKLEYQ